MTKKNQILSGAACAVIATVLTAMPAWAQMRTPGVLPKVAMWSAP
jgi:hypothetical protein